jgi:hypothetical protein
VPRCYKKDSWSNDLIVSQSSAGKNVTTVAENIVEIRHQATTGEDTEDWEELAPAVVNCGVYELAIAV